MFPDSVTDAHKHKENNREYYYPEFRLHAKPSEAVKPDETTLLSDDRTVDGRNNLSVS